MSDQIIKGYNGKFQYVKSVSEEYSLSALKSQSENIAQTIAGLQAKKDEIDSLIAKAKVAGVEE